MIYSDVWNGFGFFVKILLKIFENNFLKKNLKFKIIFLYVFRYIWKGFCFGIMLIFGFYLVVISFFG